MSNTKEVLFAYDRSGSTSGSFEYHAVTQKVLSKVLQGGDPVVLLWDHTASVSDVKTLKEINANRRGYGGTSPSVVAEYIVKAKFSGKLVLITDGEISSHDVDKADSILRKWTFEEVECHLIQRAEEPNMSCTCPFTRNSTHRVFFHNERTGASWMPCGGVSEEEMKICEDLDSIADVVRFEEVFPVLERYVVARTMGTNGDITLRNKLLVGHELQQSSGRDASHALEVAQEMVNNYFSAQAGLWSKRISKLVSMTEGSIRNAFGQSAINNRLDRAEDIQVSEAKDVPAAGDDLSSDKICGSSKFVCPISFDEEREVVLLVTKNDPILPGLEKYVMDDLLNCPLNAFKYPQVIKALIDRIDHPVGLSTFKEGHSMLKTSPFTRREVIGGLVFGRSDPEFAASSNWTLSMMLSNGKVCGNLDLWFAVIWMLVQSEVQYLADIVPFLEDQMKWRLSNSTTSASLCGLPEFVTTRVQLGTALWFVLASPFLRIPAAADPIRFHVTHLKSLKHLFKLTGFQLPDGADKCHNRVEVLLRLLGMSKKMSSIAFDSLIKALYQKAHRIARDQLDESVTSSSMAVVPWVLLDGPACAEQVAHVLEHLPGVFSTLPVNEIVGLARMVSPSMSASMIDLKHDWVAPGLPAPQRKWTHGAYGMDDEMKAPLVKVCRSTCRPYSVVDGVSWEDCAISHFRTHRTLLSTHKAFGTFTSKYLKYPSLDELLLFLFNKYAGNGGTSCNTLPSQAVMLVQQTIEDFQEVMECDSPQEAASRFNYSVTLAKRKIIESDEINLLIEGRYDRGLKNASYYFSR